MTNHFLRIQRLVCLAILGFFFAGITFATTAEGQTNISPLLEIGGNKFAGWSGFASTSQGIGPITRKFW